MKKIFIVVLMIFVIGCAKKYVKAPEEPVKTGEPVTEEKLKTEKVEEEVVEERVFPTEEKIKESVIPTEPELVTKAGAILKDVHFDFDKYNIRPDARPILDSVASWLNKNIDINILVEGHCDERGTNEYNLALGEKRAKAVRDYLVSLGVSSLRLSVITYGEEKPLCTEKNEGCWQRNRRAHFVYTK